MIAAFDLRYAFLRRMLTSLHRYVRRSWHWVDQIRIFERRGRAKICTVAEKDRDLVGS